MNKISIKDIFNSDKNLVNPDDTEIVAPEQVVENRMIKLSKALEQKDIVLKEQTEKKIDSNKVQKEIERIKEVARLNEWSANQYTGNIPTVMGQGQTVNTFIPRPADDRTNFVNMNANPNSNNVYNPKFSYLSDAEALRLSISRALNSGDQSVNKLGFYEEINQTLNQLGFLSKSPLAIKEMIIKMMDR